MILSGQNTIDYERGMADAEADRPRPEAGDTSAYAIGYAEGIANMLVRDQGGVPQPASPSTIRRVNAAPRRSEEFS